MRPPATSGASVYSEAVRHAVELVLDMSGFMYRKILPQGEGLNGLADAFVVSRMYKVTLQALLYT
jgi:hypothetical protein